MDQQILVEIARLVSRQSALLVVMAVAMVLGGGVLGWEIYGAHKALQGVAASVERVAALTAEALRRLPERP
jgi:uncharacterized protein (DUF1786 family)